MSELTPAEKTDKYMTSVDKGYNAWIVGNERTGDEALKNFQAFLNSERTTNPQAFTRELAELANDHNFSLHRNAQNNQDIVLEFDSPYGKRSGNP